MSRKFAVVSAREAALSPYPYVYMEKDGSARELHPDERKSLEEEFEGGDGNRPYVKKHHDSRDGWGSLAGFCRRDALPASLSVGAAPAENPNRPMGREEFAKFLRERGMELEPRPDGTMTLKTSKPGRPPQ